MAFFAQYNRGAYKAHSYRNEQSLLYLPDAYHRDNTKRGIVFLHGLDGSYKQGGSGSTGSAFEEVFPPILSMLQMPILAIDAGSSHGQVLSKGSTLNITGGPNSWGNPTAVQSLVNMHAWATATGVDFHEIDPAFKATGGVILIGYSMGGIIAHNFAARNPSLVKAIVTVAMPVDLDDIYTSNRNGYASAMDTAYNGPQTGTPTVTGTAGATNYRYRGVPVLNTSAAPMDGAASTQSSTFAGVAMGSLGGSPNTVSWTVPVVNTSLRPIGYRVVRSRDNGSTWESSNSMIVGASHLGAVAASGATTLTLDEGLAYAIPNGTTLVLHDTDWLTTATATTTAVANATATSISITGFSPSRTFGTGARVLPTKFVDTLTTAQTAYTAVTAPWTTNGRNHTQSYDPTLYMPAGLTAIEHQLWWSSNDTVVEASAGTPGTPTPNVQAYKDAYGANCTLKELDGDPVHGLAWTGFDDQAISDLLAFLESHA